MKHVCYLDSLILIIWAERITPCKSSAPAFPKISLNNEGNKNTPVLACYWFGFFSQIKKSKCFPVVQEFSNSNSKYILKYPTSLTRILAISNFFYFILGFCVGNKTWCLRRKYSYSTWSLKIKSDLQLTIMEIIHFTNMSMTWKTPNQV